jgi:hypothetical protein
MLPLMSTGLWKYCCYYYLLGSRDGSGDIVAASSTFVPYFVDAPMAEAYALKEGLMLAQYIGVNV